MAITAKRGVNWPLVGLLLAALLVRGSVLWAMRGNLDQDPDAYREIAENLIRHGEFALGRGDPAESGSDYRPTAYRPPLYPLVLSNLAAADRQQVSLLKIASLHLLLGVATVWLTWITALRCGRSAPQDAISARGASGPLLASVLIAFDPLLLNQQTLVMTETLATFLAILSLWCLTKFSDQPTWFNAALAGGTIGLAILCRPTFLPWLGLLLMAIPIAPLILRLGRCPDRASTADCQVSLAIVHRLTTATVLTLFAIAILSPWAIRNYRVFGRPIVTTTHGGYTLYLGNNESFYRHLLQPHELPWVPDSGFWYELSKYSILPSLHEPTELFHDRYAYEVAKLAIKENPETFVIASIYRIRQLWSPLPHKLTADESTSRCLLRYATCAWYLTVYALAAISIWKLRWNLLQPPWLYGILLCVAFTAVHTFYWTNLRMRAPLMPFVALVAAAAEAKVTRRAASDQRSR